MGSAAWLAFFVSMIAAALTGLSYASIGSRYPKAAGSAYATYRAFRSGFLSYVIGLAALASGLTSMATASRIFSGYFIGLFQGISLEVVIVVFSILISVIVFIGIKESLMANALCTLIEVSGLLLILVVGVTYLGSVNYLDATTIENPTGDLSLSLILSGAVLTFYSFVGFEDILNVSEEVQEPKRTVPRALIGAVLISSVIYMGISLVAVSVVPADILAASSQPLVDVVIKAAPWFPTSIFSSIAMFAVANTALLNFIMGSRLLYGMARHGLLPSPLANVHRARKTPHVAIITLWIIFITLALSGDISSLAKSTSVLLLFSFIIVNLSLFVLTKKEKMEGTFEVPRIVPLLGAGVCLAMLTNAKAPELLTAGALLAVIVTLYFIMRPKPDSIENL